MISELIIDVQPQVISIAVLENKNLVEFYKESRNISFVVGSIYLGKVKKVMPGLNAAFVDVGGEKEAFLHYRNLGEDFYSSMEFLKVIFNQKKIPSIHNFSCSRKLENKGAITDVLKQGDDVLVQIVKEPISTKGLRLTAVLSFVGRYLILIPFSDKINISSKIQCEEERIRLKQLVLSIKPKNFTIIIRTASKGKKVAELDKELTLLVKCWENYITKLLKSKAPSLIYEEMGKVVTLIRDSFNTSFERIYINDDSVYHDVKNYIELIDSTKLYIIKLYNSKLPILDKFAITKQLKSRFGKIVTLKNGSYLILEHTEAMYVIDVNSGNCSSTKNQEDMTMEINLRAALEIARQIRLRDIGGIIVVDFIDMDEDFNRRKLYDTMCNCMVNDRAKHHIYPLSRSGLMEITRKRVRPVLNFGDKNSCPFCSGSISLQSSLLFIDFLSKKVEMTVTILKIKKFYLFVHPYIAAFINQGIFSLKIQWKLKYFICIRVVSDQNIGIFEYHFFDKYKKEIIIQNESNVEINI